MKNDLFFVSFTIFTIIGLIYLLYKIMLSSEKNNDNKGPELQITSQGILDQLIILRKQKKYNIVESLAGKYLAQKPGDDSVRTILAKSLYDAGKTHAAIDQTKIILRRQPKNVNMQIFIANCYKDIDKPIQAIDVLENVIERDPSNAVAIKELAQVYLNTHQKKSAIKMFKKLEDFLESNNEKVKNKVIIADIYIDFNDYSSAIKEYKDILEIYPDEINGKKKLVELYKLNENYIPLLDLANEILETSEGTNALWAMKRLMETYKVMRNYEKAMELATLIKEHPMSNEIEASENIAKILFEAGNIHNCITLLNSLIVKDPSNIKLKKYLANAYEASKDFEMAVNVYKKIIDIIPAKDIEQSHFELSNLYSNWAMYLFEQNNTDECFKHFIVALKYYASNPDIYYKLGLVNQLIKNFNEAIIQYKKAIELDNDNPQYYYAIAECYEEIDSIYEEKKALIECLKYNQNNAKIYFKLGTIYNLQNDTNSAIFHMKKAIELDDNFIDAKYKLALILEHIGNIEEAVALYEQILLLNPSHEEVANNLKMLKS